MDDALFLNSDREFQILLHEEATSSHWELPGILFAFSKSPLTHFSKL